jgi:hypothetical protein
MAPPKWLACSEIDKGQFQGTGIISNNNLRAKESEISFTVKNLIKIGVKVTVKNKALKRITILTLKTSVCGAIPINVKIYIS